MNAVPLSILIEANECLKLARATAPAGAYVRMLDAQYALEVEIKLALAGQVVGVSA